MHRRFISPNSRAHPLAPGRRVSYGAAAGAGLVLEVYEDDQRSEGGLIVPGDSAAVPYLDRAS